MRKFTNDEAVKKIEEVNANFHNGKYNFIEFVGGEYENVRTKLVLECPVHGKWDSVDFSHFYYRHFGCPSCNFRTKLTNENALERINKTIQELNPEYKFHGFVDGEKYTGLRCKLILECPIHGIWKTSGFECFTYKKQGCPKCGNVNHYTQEEAIKQINKIIDDYDMNLTFIDFVGGKYETNISKCHVLCNKHNIICTTSLANICTGRNPCKECKNEYFSKLKLAPEEEVVEKVNNKINKCKYPFKFIGFKNGKYVGSNDTYLLLECEKHGVWDTTSCSSFLSNGSGCPSCNMSKGERNIKLFLEELNIEFEQQKTFYTCRNKQMLPFDFYLPIYNTLIEFDGIQHFKPLEWFGGEDSYLALCDRDNIKTNWAKENSIDLVRFNYEQTDEEVRNKLYEILVAKAEKMNLDIPRLNPTG